MIRNKNYLLLIMFSMMIVCLFVIFMPITSYEVNREYNNVFKDNAETKDIIMYNNNDYVDLHDEEISLGDTCGYDCSGYLSGSTCYSGTADGNTKDTCTGHWVSYHCYKFSSAATYKCTSCDRGKYINGNSCSTCPSGKYCRGGSSQPINCSPGTYSTGGASSCTPCPAGTYQDASGQTRCKSCEGNTYTNTTGQRTCKKCGVNRVQSDHQGCRTCSANTTFDDKKTSPGDPANFYVVYRDCIGRLSITGTGGTTSGSSNINGSGAMPASIVTNTPCTKMSVDVTLSNDGASLSAGKVEVEVVDEWRTICTDCSIQEDLDNKFYADKNAADSYGSGKEALSDSNGNYYHYDEVKSRSCNKPKPIKTYDYCCVDNELPGLSQTVFSVTRARSQNCNYYAGIKGKPIAAYTLLLASPDGNFNMSKCQAPPPIPGTCKPSPIIVDNNQQKNATTCETTMTLSTSDGEQCTNNDNNSNKSFYRIKCNTDVKTKFEYADDDDTNSSRSLLRGQGFDYGIYVDSKVTCEYTFYDDVWLNVYNNFIQKIKLIDDNLELYARNNDSTGWENYIRNNWKNKLKDTNVRTLYELWNIIERLKEIVEYYNKYTPNNNYNESANIKMETKENGTPVNIEENFDMTVLSQGVFSEHDVVVKNLGIKNLKNPKNYILTHGNNPRKIKLTPKKKCVDTYDGKILSPNEETAECKEKSLDGGNKIYTSLNTDAGTYGMSLVVKGLGAVQSERSSIVITNSECDVDVAKVDIKYRSIDVGNPFINDKWERGENWVNDKYDFTKAIHANTWNVAKKAEITLQSREIDEVKRSNNSNYNAYLGLCDNIRNLTGIDSKICNVASKLKGKQN